MATVVVITRDKSKAQAIHNDLAAGGHLVISACNADETIRVLSRKPDLALVDGLDFPLTSDIWPTLAPSPAQKAMAIVVLSSESHLQDWESSQEADDLLVTPYRKQELLTRVRRLLHKSGKAESGTIVRHGDLTIDDAGYEVKVSGGRIDLTFREYQLLRYLAVNPSKVFTRDNLLNKVWGYDYFGGDRTVDVHIRRLRSKLEDAGHIFIETVRNVGYRFKPQDGQEAEEPMQGGKNESIRPRPGQ